MLSFSVFHCMYSEQKELQSLTGWRNIQNLDFNSFFFCSEHNSSFGQASPQRRYKSCWCLTPNLNCAALQTPLLCSSSLFTASQITKPQHKDGEETVCVQLKCHLNANTKPCNTQCCAMVRIQSCELLIQTARLHCELQLTGGPCIPLGPSSPGRPCEKQQSHGLIRKIKMERDGLMVSQGIY